MCWCGGPPGSAAFPPLTWAASTWAALFLIPRCPSVTSGTRRLPLPGGVSRSGTAVVRRRSHPIPERRASAASGTPGVPLSRGQGNFRGSLECSMDDKTDAAGARRVAISPRLARVGMFAIAVIVGSTAGVMAARFVTWHVAPVRGGHAVAAQLVGQSGSAPPSFADLVDVVKPAAIGVQTKLSESADDEQG